MSPINFRAFSDELEKIALLDQIAGGFIGHHYGKKQKARREDYKFGPAQVAGSLLLPGGIGYQVGRYVAHHPNQKNGKTKHSARLEQLEKAAGFLRSMGKLTGKAAVGIGEGLNAAKSTLGNAAGKASRAVLPREVRSNLGSVANKIKSTAKAGIKDFKSGFNVTNPAKPASAASSLPGLKKNPLSTK